MLAEADTEIASLHAVGVPAVCRRIHSGTRGYERSANFPLGTVRGHPLMNTTANAPKWPAVFALLLVLSPLTLGATDWTGSLGDWFIAGNWSQGVPASNSDASIGNGGTALVSADEADEMISPHRWRPSAGHLV